MHSLWSGPVTQFSLTKELIDMSGLPIGTWRRQEDSYHKGRESWGQARFHCGWLGSDWYKIKHTLSPLLLHTLTLAHTKVELYWNARTLSWIGELRKWVLTWPMPYSRRTAGRSLLSQRTTGNPSSTFTSLIRAPRWLVSCLANLPSECSLWPILSWRVSSPIHFQVPDRLAQQYYIQEARRYWNQS